MRGILSSEYLTRLQSSKERSYDSSRRHKDESSERPAHHSCWSLCSMCAGCSADFGADVAAGLVFSPGALRRLESSLLKLKSVAVFKGDYPHPRVELGCNSPLRRALWKASGSCICGECPKSENSTSFAPLILATACWASTG